MQHAHIVLRAGSWAEDASDTIVLDYESRFRRRLVLTGTRGTEFLLDLEKTQLLRNGDALKLDDGRLVEIIAAPEALTEVKAADPQRLLRLVWHLGNRHVQVAFAGNKIRIRRDRLVEDMLRALGGKCAEIEAPFDPEGGAYDAHEAAAAAHDAGNTHDHGHAAHDHAHHDHDHAGHDHAHHGHDHADHDHDHDHSHGDHGHGHRHE